MASPWDVLVAVTAVLGLGVSLYNFAFQRKQADDQLSVAEAAAQRATFLQVYQQFLSPVEQEARRAVYEIRDSGQKYAESGDSMPLINHAVAFMNLVGYLLQEGQIPRRDTLALIGGSAARVYEAAEAIGYFEVRKSQNKYPPWDHFNAFVLEIRANEFAISEIRAKARRGSATPLL